MSDVDSVDVEWLRSAVSESVQSVLATKLDRKLSEDASEFVRERAPGRAALFTAAVGNRYGAVGPVRAATVVELHRLRAVCHAEEQRVLVGDGFRSVADWALLDGPWSSDRRLAAISELANASACLNANLYRAAGSIDTWFAVGAAKLANAVFPLSDAVAVSVREAGRAVQQEGKWCGPGALESPPQGVEEVLRAVSGTEHR
jgi:hypothetical protein